MVISNPKTRECLAPKSIVSETVQWDDEVAQLGLRRRGKSLTWIVQWRENGKTRKRSLGNQNTLAREDARHLARTILEGHKAGCAHVQASPTIAAFSERFLGDFVAVWKPKTLRANRYDVERRILPHLGSLKLPALTPEDVRDWMVSLTCRPSSINRALAVLSGMMRHAEVLGERPPGSNPCKGLRRRDTSFRASYLSEAQWARLGNALKIVAPDYPVEITCIRFLALTGCRKGEALGLRWDMIGGDVCLLPDSKTGPRAIWLGKPAKRLLTSLPRCSDHVFTREGDPLPVHGLTAAWHAIRKDARLPNLRLHDLRHSFASVGINAGIDLRVIGGLLGHADTNTTEGYAHLEDRTLRAASQRVGTHLEKLTTRGAPPKRNKADGSLFHAFCNSSLSMAAFCEQHALDPKRFRADLARWRAAFQSRMGGAS